MNLNKPIVGAIAAAPTRALSAARRARLRRIAARFIADCLTAPRRAARAKDDVGQKVSPSA